MLDIHDGLHSTNTVPEVKNAKMQHVTQRELTLGLGLGLEKITL